MSKIIDYIELLAMASIYEKRANILNKIQILSPLVRQAYPYSCGAACLLSVILYWNPSSEINESRLISELDCTPRDGTSFRKIVQIARSHDLKASIRSRLSHQELQNMLDTGQTIILNFQAWSNAKENKSQDFWKKSWDNGHYAVLVGADNKYFYFMDPAVPAAYSFMSIPEFYTRFHDRKGNNDYFGVGIVISGKHHKSNLPGRLVQIK